MTEIQLKNLNELRNWCVKHASSPDLILKMPVVYLAQNFLNLSTVLVALIDAINREEPQAIPSEVKEYERN